MTPSLQRQAEHFRLVIIYLAEKINENETYPTESADRCPQHAALGNSITAGVSSPSILPNAEQTVSALDHYSNASLLSKRLRS